MYIGAEWGKLMVSDLMTKLNLKTKIVGIGFAATTMFSMLVERAFATAHEIAGPLGDVDIAELINRLSSIVVPITVIAFLGVVIYGGFTRLTAAGDPEKEKKSVHILTAGIIGFLIIVFAPLIVGFIGEILNIQGGIIDINDVEP